MRAAEFGQSPGVRSAALSENQATTKNTATATAKPPTTVRPSLRSPACQTSSAASETSPMRVRGDRAALGRARLAPDHAHRGHVLQLDQRRQREAEQQHQADEEALHRGQHARRRQLGAHHFRHRHGDRLLRDVAEGTAGRAGANAEQHELDRRTGAGAAPASRRGSASPRSRRGAARRSGACRARRRRRRASRRAAPSGRGSAPRGRSPSALRAGRFPACRCAGRGPSAVSRILRARSHLLRACPPHTGNTRPGCRSGSARWPARRRCSSSGAARY